MVDAEEDKSESKTSWRIPCNPSKFKLQIVLAIIYFICTAYVIIFALDGTRWIIRQTLPESPAIVMLVGAGMISGTMTLYLVSYGPLWITLILYHFSSVVVPLLYWIFLRIAGYVIFLGGGVYLFARFVLGVDDPIGYVYNMYRYIDLLPSMIDAQLENYGGVWGYLRQWYL